MHLQHFLCTFSFIFLLVKLKVAAILQICSVINCHCVLFSVYLWPPTAISIPI